MVDVEHSLEKTLFAAATDRSVAVRRVAGDKLIAKIGSLGAEAGEIAQVLSLDAYPSVAERGSFALQRLTGDA